MLKETHARPARYPCSGSSCCRYMPSSACHWLQAATESEPGGAGETPFSMVPAFSAPTSPASRYLPVHPVQVRAGRSDPKLGRCRSSQIALQVGASRPIPLGLSPSLPLSVSSLSLSKRSLPFPFPFVPPLSCSLSLHCLADRRRARSASSHELHLVELEPERGKGRKRFPGNPSPPGLTRSLSLSPATLAQVRCLFVRPLSPLHPRTTRLFTYLPPPPRRCTRIHVLASLRLRKPAFPSTLFPLQVRSSPARPHKPPSSSNRAPSPALALRLHRRPRSRHSLRASLHLGPSSGTLSKPLGFPHLKERAVVPPATWRPARSRSNRRRIPHQHRPDGFDHR